MNKKITLAIASSPPLLALIWNNTARALSLPMQNAQLWIMRQSGQKDKKVNRSLEMAAQKAVEELKSKGLIPSQG